MCRVSEWATFQVWRVAGRADKPGFKLPQLPISPADTLRRNA